MSIIGSLRTAVRPAGSFHSNELRVYTSVLRRTARGVAVMCALAAPVWVAVATRPAAAQQQASQRVVQGKVVDKGDAPLKGAVVYLKDSHTLTVKTFFAGDDGSYRFGQLAGNTDYSLWAESDGKKSAVKNISSFDTRKEFNIVLKVEGK